MFAPMKSELYFDISTETSGGTLFRQPDGSFLWQHSTYDDDRDETKVFRTAYPSFDAFWNMLVGDREWYFQHPLFVHPEVRPFVKQQLQSVNWTAQGDAKWQISHQRQWTKVLSDNVDYYNPF